jgi:multidrug efflux system membrane fusion protein
LLGEENAVSRQELDERRAAFNQAQADLAAVDANVRRLETMQGLRRIEAPFHGVVARRNAEVGALISANATTGRELYQLAEIDVLRIDLAVPQAYAAEIRPGLPCRCVGRNGRDRRWRARSAGSRPASTSPPARARS